MKKIRLLTPGPTPVPERISLRMAQPIVHHRSPEFEQVFARVREGLAWLFQTKKDVVQFASSGTGAMEAALVNFLRKGDTAIVIDGGKFGERWGKLAKSHGVNGVALKVEWGNAVDPAAVERFLPQPARDTRRVLVSTASRRSGPSPPPFDWGGTGVLPPPCHKAL